MEFLRLGGIITKTVGKVGEVDALLAGEDPIRQNLRHHGLVPRREFLLTTGKHPDARRLLDLAQDLGVDPAGDGSGRQVIPEKGQAPGAMLPTKDPVEQASLLNQGPRERQPTLARGKLREQPPGRHTREPIVVGRPELASGEPGRHLGRGAGRELDALTGEVEEGVGRHG
jgi:hypothetical protein